MTFGRPFVLDSYGDALPAGRYEVEIDEERLEGLSFPAYRQVSMQLHLNPSPAHPGRHEILTLNPRELDEAVRRDQAAAASDPPNADAAGLTETLIPPDE
ncbi:MAG: hypothetical protein RLT05_20680 [Bauldia litoralis]